MKKDLNGWINVKDHLPEEGQHCFVWFEDKLYGVDWCHDFFLDGEFDVTDVTHWRPIFDGPTKRKK